MKALLLPVSWLYAAGVALRNRVFDIGLLNAEAVGVPVISIGNMTAGGTGKTPLVEYVVRQCLEEGKRTAVVSRGYGRRSSGVVVVADGRELLTNVRVAGDEAFQIARKFPAVIVVVGERRVDAARRAVALGAEVIVLDDGFQHRYLHRDLDVVVVDGKRGLADEWMLPAGRKREPLGGLRRAHAIAVSQKEDADSAEKVKRSLARLSSAPVACIRYEVCGVFPDLDACEVQLSRVRERKALAFSGIAHHEDFVRQLKDSGFRIQGDMRFPDHHWYSEDDMRKLIARAEGSSSEILMTTEKDFVRLTSFSRKDLLLKKYETYFTRIEVRFTEGESVFRALLARCIRGATA